MGRVYVVGTADTKGEELAYIAAAVRAAGGDPLIVDVGTRSATIDVDVTSGEVAVHGTKPVSGDDRGAAVSAMAEAFASYLPKQNDIAGVIGIGGSGGTSIVCAGMRRLRIGIPKMMVSTLASGDVAPYIDVSDIVMVPSITDLAGLNRISRVVLSHAARAIVAMSHGPLEANAGKPAIGLTMFGVTTAAVTRIAQALGDDFEPLIFHATGMGGRTMEALVDSGLLAGVLDITTTEIADLLFGGVLPALPGRLDCIARTSIPYVGAPGACDMVNFFAPDTIPQKYAGRRFYRHNSNVTLMRTSPGECRQIGEWIGRKLAACEGPVRFLLPERGVSALDAEGGVFADLAADQALFEGIEAAGNWTGARRLIRLDMHINDIAFADATVGFFREIAG